ncbi:hypothetical protein Moror_4108 [Moniliophthora roreri MCA 2997]|uniref:Uncharacterized protein n=1 Tax=Moniliophthora roreri (strain MCA 2997) TaxID=1381753 RepID=V2XAG7_MONRO|nr:hypothetical protein Moror_4108 [Moniliophthora roreri MCA 2997]
MYTHERIQRQSITIKRYYHKEVFTKNAEIEEGAGAVKDELPRKDPEEPMASTELEAAGPSSDAQDEVWQ